MNDRSTLETIWKESVETFRTQIKLAIQLITIFIVADVTLIGYGSKEGSAIMIWVGAIFLILILVQLYVVKKVTYPILYTAINLEDKLNLENKVRLTTNYLQFLTKRSVHEVQQITKSSIISEMESSGNLKDYDLFGIYSHLPRVFIVIVLLLQIVGPIILVILGYWELV